MSLVAEVYTLHTPLMAAILLLLLRWDESPTPQRLVVVALLFGLSCGNHAATVLLLPGCIWFVATHPPRRWLTSRILTAVTLAAFAGLAIYFLLPLRFGQNPLFNYTGQYAARTRLTGLIVAPMLLAKWWVQRKEQAQATPENGWWTALLAGDIHPDNWLDLCFVLIFLVLGLMLLFKRR